MELYYLPIHPASRAPTPTTAVITSPPVSPKTSPIQKPPPFDCGGDPESCEYVPESIRKTYKESWSLLEGFHQRYCPTTRRLSEEPPKSPGRRGAVGGTTSPLQPLDVRKAENIAVEFGGSRKRRRCDLSSSSLEEGEIKEYKRKVIKYGNSLDGKKVERESTESAERNPYGRKKVRYGSSIYGSDGKENEKVVHEIAEDVAEQVMEDVQAMWKVKKWMEGVDEVPQANLKMLQEMENKTPQEEQPASKAPTPVTIQATSKDFEDFGSFIERNDIFALSDKYGFIVIKTNPEWLVNHPRNVRNMRDLLHYRNAGCVSLSEQRVSRLGLQTQERIYKVLNIKKFSSNRKRSYLTSLDKFLDKGEQSGVLLEGELEGMCNHMEEVMEKGVDTVYGQDCDASILLPKLNVAQASLSHLNGNELYNLQSDVGGLSTDYAYVGVGGSVFAMHIEDWNIHSMNIHIWGAPKVWFFVSPHHKQQLEDAIADAIGYTGFKCSQFVRHEALYLSEEFLQKYGVEYTKYQQEPGDLLFISPWAYHQGFNAGTNVAVANNYGSAKLRSEGYYDVAGGKYINCVNGECKLICQPIELHFKYYKKKNM